ncbi:ABC transporter substrate-binding protein (plasmid) [Deinococcus metallilatus]|uniref:Peptide/nickel transport system substrate-binding protein n=1 Tax=Deinococcus metallilatus TaxID=1211322 RepID=A0ABR6MYD7_9DEIO|nr:ABC transporter substrate-binding protein [Deinococcus metallilatus]MBB5296956.1 peptide/nickel transport system substrate-binding protein [Deinococcus metallilatus]QBY06676.1 ABC transporter substrate-binding protein [Deinococcus metallilatus]GMA15145.1 peptide-binding protein [Deinococcus metallilatus]
MSKRFLLSLALACAALPGSALADKVITGAFDVGPGGAPQAFNPLTNSAGFTWLNKYFGTLVLYDVNFKKISGDLASSWTVADGGKKYTFVLRPDVKWHDGQPFTARDVKFTIDLAMNPDSGSPFASKFANIKNVQTPNDRTVILTLSKPNAALLDGLTNFMILPQHELAKIPAKELRNSAWWRTNPVGTGPFMWSKYVPDQYVELKANPGYYRGKPKIDRLVNRYFKEPAAAVLALKSGDIQFTYLSLDDTKNVGNNVNIIAGPSQVVNYIGLNGTDPRFKDPRIRQAVMYAIDRATIVKQLYGGGAELANCVVTNSKFVPKGLNAYGYDPAKARQLLQAAKWNPNENVELLTYYGDQLSKDVLVTIQQMLAQVGMKVTPRFVDPPTFGQTTDKAKPTFEMVYAGSANGPDPDVMYANLHSDFMPPNGTNRMRVNIPAIDKDFEAGQAETSPAKRVAIYQDLCQVSNAQLPWDTLWVAKRFGGASKNLVNFIWTPAPGGGRYDDHAEDWDIK